MFGLEGLAGSLRAGTDTMFYYMEIGGMSFVRYFLYAQLGYFLLKVVYDLAARFVLRTSDHLKFTGKIFKFLLLFNLVLAGYFAFAGLILRQIKLHAAGADLIANNAFYLELDYRFLGVYLPFWLQSTMNPLKVFWDALAPYLIGSFVILSAIISLIFIISLAVSGEVFTRLTVTFILVSLMGTPFWYFRPALSPLQGYIDNLTEARFSPRVQHSLGNYSPAPLLEKFLEGIREGQKRSEKRILLYTTMPSMHVAWSVVVLYFAWQISQFLGVWMLIYVSFNAVATIFTAQHYTVDAPVGTILALLAIYLAQRWVSGAPKVVQDITDLIQSDLNRAFRFSRERVQRVRDDWQQKLGLCNQNHQDLRSG